MLLTILVGPPGSGKSTLAKSLINDDGDLGAATVYVNQDAQGKEGHLRAFEAAITNKQDIIVDRMNFDKNQRIKYLGPAMDAGYKVKIIVLHESYQTCLKRMLERKNHETIKDETNARAALHTFFTKYERPETSNPNIEVEFRYPNGPKPSAIVVDLDGTLCDVTHRRHHVRPPENTLVGPDGSMISILGKLDVVDPDEPLPKFKKNWPAFFKGIAEDKVNKWCAEIVHTLGMSHVRVLCSGRGEEYRQVTEEWLMKHDIAYDHLFMRKEKDSRADFVVKEIILDFEILTRFTPYLFIDDRDQVVQLWRRRGYVCLQCDEGSF